MRNTSWIARLAPLAVLFGAACEGETQNDVEEARAPLSLGADADLVYESIRVSDGDQPIRERTRGALSVEQWQRAARPWTYFDEPYLYHEQTWERQREDGTFEQGYRIVRTRNDARAPESAPPGPPSLGAGVAERAAEDGDAAIILRLRDYPRWNVPLPPPMLFDESERQRTLAARAQAMEARRMLFAERAAPVRAAIERAGGAMLDGTGWSAGYVLATMPARALPALFQRRDLARIDLIEGEAEDALIDPTNNTISWNLGEARWATRTGADRFHQAGIDGSTPNPGRHAFGRIAAAMVEIGRFEDEACYFSDGGSCSGPSRIMSRVDCSGTDMAEPACQSVATFDDGDEPLGPTQGLLCCSTDSDCSTDGSWSCVTATQCNATTGRACVCNASPRCGRHATTMACLLGANYRDHQCDCLSCGDNACASGCVHDSIFANRASGMAPEAAMLLWGGMARDVTDPTNNAIVMARAFGEAFVGLQAANADVVNDSWVWTAADAKCDEIPTYPFELEAENAYDDGVFVLAAAGNTPGTTGCDIQSLADIPKVFAVNGLPTASLGNGNLPDCNGNYNNCRMTPQASATGGIPAMTPDLVEHAGALTAIALAAPVNLDYNTLEAGETGVVNDDPAVQVRAFGTSSATAIMTGLSTLVKGDHLAHGLDWINSPGRMMLVMLSMGDRHFDITANQLSIGGHVDWGFGRVRLRRVDDFSQRATTTYTLTSPQVWAPFATPMAADTNLMKCVLLQEEDMSEKMTISNVDLTVRIQAPDSAGQCFPTAGTSIASATDSSFDIKSMIAFTSATTSLAGNCVHVAIDPLQIAGSAVTVHALCYASTYRDDENAGACASGATRSCANGGTQTCDAASGLFGPCSSAIPNACTTGQPGVCSAGTFACDGTALVCSATPGSPETCDGIDNDCNGEIDEITASDPLNCGACGNVCSFPHASASCVAGVCTMGACDTGFGDCDERAGCETSLTTIRDCGACGTLCTLRNATGECSTGTCLVASCDEGWGDCDSVAGCEASLATSANCGACGNACSMPNATSECVDGACALVSCDAGFGDCDPSAPGCEASLATDTDCGACGNACAAGSSCVDGACTAPPDAGIADAGVDSGVDAGTVERVDSGADAGAPPDEDDSCGCRAVGTGERNIAFVVPGLLALLALRRRRRR